MRNIKAVIIIVIILVISFASAEHDACIHFVNKTAGYIASPNYPDLYPDSKECVWNLEVNPGERISLTFSDFSLENDTECSTDYVAVYDGSTINGPLIGKFCSNSPGTLSSTTHRMLVKFHTDSSVQFKGFVATYTGVSNIRSIDGVENVKRNLTQLLLGARVQKTHSTNKWGTHLKKIAVTLFMDDRHLFAPDSEIANEIAYELSLQLLSKLVLKEKISIKDLTLYINALIVACIDPKNFYGFNFVEELRKRVNKSNNTHPFSFLTLCNAKDSMTMEDVRNLQEQFDANFRPVWTDVQAMVVMALSCIHSRSELNLNVSFLNDMVSNLKGKQHKNGTIDNWKTTALVLQALIAAGNYGTDFNASASVKFLLDSIGNHSNINDTYYLLPILNGMSLANINSDHCTISYQTESRSILREEPNERIQVQISVIAGDDMDFSHTWKIKVPRNYSFYEVLENIGTMEPAYKVQYSVSEGKPYIVGLANFHDNAEDGMFWLIYSKSLSSPGSLRLIDLSPVDIKVNESDEMILWYRSGFWTNLEGSGEL